jgi:hypothetical protein
MYRSMWDISVGTEILPSYEVCIVLKFCKEECQEWINDYIVQYRGTVCRH